MTPVGGKEIEGEVAEEGGHHLDSRYLHLYSHTVRRLSCVLFSDGLMSFRHHLGKFTRKTHRGNFKSSYDLKMCRQNC